MLESLLVSELALSEGGATSLPTLYELRYLLYNWVSWKSTLRDTGFEPTSVRAFWLRRLGCNKLSALPIQSPTSSQKNNSQPVDLPTQCTYQNVYY